MASSATHLHNKELNAALVIHDDSFFGLATYIVDES
jgi:hypothetical protein